jgi:hypothetical protein
MQARFVTLREDVVAAPHTRGTSIKVKGVAGAKTGHVVQLSSAARYFLFAHCALKENGAGTNRNV